jgi:hypothetical protein
MSADRQLPGLTASGQGQPPGPTDGQTALTHPCQLTDRCHDSRQMDRRCPPTCQRTDRCHVSRQTESGAHPPVSCPMMPLSGKTSLTRPLPLCSRNLEPSVVTMPAESCHSEWQAWDPACHMPRNGPLPICGRRAWRVLTKMRSLLWLPARDQMSYSARRNGPSVSYRRLPWRVLFLGGCIDR